MRHFFRGGAAFVALAVAMISPASAAEPSPPGASSCSGCHAAGSPVPPLSGLPAERIVSEMAAFRSGERAQTVMTRIAKGFDDAETRAIADWLARQEPAR